MTTKPAPSAGRLLQAGRVQAASPFRIWLFVAVLLALLAALAWASDTVTLEGERTIFTADCLGGDWQGVHCGGRLAAGERYRYRALKAHGEVIFWRVGGSGHSAKFSDCEIHDGRNWSCRPNEDSAQSVTQQMVHGFPVPDPSRRTLAYHAIPKWRWWLLHLGLPAGSDANN